MWRRVWRCLNASATVLPMSCSLRSIKTFLPPIGQFVDQRQSARVSELIADLVESHAVSDPVNQRLRPPQRSSRSRRDDQPITRGNVWQVVMGQILSIICCATSISCRRRPRRLRRRRSPSIAPLSSNASASAPDSVNCRGIDGGAAAERQHLPQRHQHAQATELARRRRGANGKGATYETPATAARRVRAPALTQSIAFFISAGTEALYSGLTISTPLMVADHEARGRARCLDRARQTGLPDSPRRRSAKRIVIGQRDPRDPDTGQRDLLRRHGGRPALNGAGAERSREQRGF